MFAYRRIEFFTFLSNFNKDGCLDIDWLEFRNTISKNYFFKIEKSEIPNI